MPPTPDRPGSVRSAALVNEEIRAFWLRLEGRVPTAAERREYELLVAEGGGDAGRGDGSGVT